MTRFCGDLGRHLIAVGFFLTAAVCFVGITCSPRYCSPPGGGLMGAGQGLAPAGEILNGMVFRQPLNVDRLAKLELKLATYARVNHGVVKCYIKNDKTGKILHSLDIQMEHIEDNVYKCVYCGSDYLDVENTSVFLEGTPDCVQGNAITCWTQDGADTCYINGNKGNKTACMITEGLVKKIVRPMSVFALIFVVLGVGCMFLRDSQICQFLRSHAISAGAIGTAFSLRVVLLGVVLQRVGDENDIYCCFYEMVLLTGALIVTPRRLRWLLLTFLVVYSAQVVHLTMCSCFILPETLQNLCFWDEVGSMAYLSGVLFIGVMALWSPDLWLDFLPPRNRLPRTVFACVLVGFVVLHSSCCHLPSNRFLSAIRQIVGSGSRVATNDDYVRFKNDFVCDRIPVSGRSQAWFNQRPKNVIIFFFEGFSKEVMTEEFMPNLCRIERVGVSFRNYYNHTAATLKGIRGQLISGFVDSEDLIARQMSERMHPTGIVSLAEIANKAGYQSVFISPHNRRSKFQEIISSSGFAVSDNPDGADRSDKEMMRLALATVKRLSDVDYPYFIVVYCVGTHLGLDSPDKKFGDGSNALYNKFHNLDYWIGDFYSEFTKSRASDGTLVVFTTDHATFPTAEYRSSFHSKQKHFAGEIPLIFCGKYVIPGSLDASFRNSLALAPTICDILKITDCRNAFLGRTLFDGRRTVFESYYKSGSEVLRCDNGEYQPVQGDDPVLERLECYLTVAR